MSTGRDPFEVVGALESPAWRSSRTMSTLARSLQGYKERLTASEARCEELSESVRVTESALAECRVHGARMRRDNAELHEENAKLRADLQALRGGAALTGGSLADVSGCWWWVVLLLALVLWG